MVKKTSVRKTWKVGDNDEDNCESSFVNCDVLNHLNLLSNEDESEYPQAGSSEEQNEKSLENQIPDELQELFFKCRIQFVKDKGRGVICQEVIEPGTTILKEEPMVALVKKQNNFNACHYCFNSSTDTLLACSKCKFCRYCSFECQREDWADHKLECESILKDSEQKNTEFIRLMARLLRKRYRDHEKMKILRYLISNKEETLKSRGESIVGICFLLKKLVGERMMIQNTNELLHLISRIQSNATCIRGMNSMGLGIFAAYSFINHNCDPNVVVSFQKRTLYVRSIKKINPGEEICFSYVDHLHPRDLAKSKLKKEFYFKCSCQTCLYEENDPRKCFKCPSCNGPVFGIQCKDCKRFLSKSYQLEKEAYFEGLIHAGGRDDEIFSILYPSHHILIEYLCSHISDLSCYKKLVESLDFVYPKYDPQLLIWRYQGILIHQDVNDIELFEIAKETLNRFKISFPDTEPAIKALRNFLDFKMKTLSEFHK